jgi:hypothetical protein
VWFVFVCGLVWLFVWMISDLQGWQPSHIHILTILFDCAWWLTLFCFGKFRGLRFLGVLFCVVLCCSADTVQGCYLYQDYVCVSVMYRCRAGVGHANPATRNVRGWRWIRRVPCRYDGRTLVDVLAVLAKSCVLIAGLCVCVCVSPLRCRQ